MPTVCKSDSLICDVWRDHLTERPRGYALALPPERICIGTVVRLLDGPLAPVPCVSKTAYKRCDDSTSEDACRIRRLTGRVRDAVADVLDTTTLADICRSVTAQDFVMSYDI